MVLASVIDSPRSAIGLTSGKAEMVAARPPAASVPVSRATE